MKIPETSANVGAYYGNEENGQWQPNGVIIDSGVGGGIVGSGDAGLHRPPVYPVHVASRGHIPAGYVMAGAYYGGGFGAVPQQDDFADYMWMENEEEFDKQVMQQLEEEALMEQCIEAMLEDEQRERQRPLANGHNHYPTTSNGGPSLSLEETVSRSTLNPLAAEFVPTRVRTSQPPVDKPETSEAPSPEDNQKSKEEKQITAVPPDSEQDIHDHAGTADCKTSDVSETPEVSAADIQPISDKKKETKKDAKVKTDTKKPVKQEVKQKSKPVPVVKSETKLVSKKKDIRIVKSDGEDKEVEVPVEVVKPPPPTQSTEQVISTSELKPINYAAAAKANKPKKTTPPPSVENTTLPPPPKTEKPKVEKNIKPAEKIEKRDKNIIKDKLKSEKPVVKTEKSVQRKNSTK